MKYMKVSERIVSTMLMSLLLFSISYSQSSVDPTHPNILLIIADDLGIDPVPGYPASIVQETRLLLKKLLCTHISKRPLKECIPQA